MSEQRVFIVGDVVRVNDDGEAQVVVGYSGGDSTTGLGLRVHYNSSALTFVSPSDVLAKDSFIVPTVPKPDTDDNFDGDVLTDVYVDASWASLFGGWPGSSAIELMTLTFEVNDPDNFDSSQINFSASSSAAGHDFIPVSGLIEAPLPALQISSSVAVDENAPAGTEVAVAASGLPEATFSITGGSSGPAVDAPELASATQHVYVSSSEMSEDGTQQTVKINYMADDPTTTGLGLRVHFDSSKLSLVDITDILSTDLFVTPSVDEIESDTDAAGGLDGDSATDSFVNIGWASLFGAWPNAESAELATLVFDIAEGASGLSAINFTASSNAAN